MKKRYLAILLIAGVVPALMSHHNGVAEEQNKDRTGAPGSDTPCSQCHSADEFAPMAGMSLLDQGTLMPVTEYVPGQTYTITFGVASAAAPAPTAHGFQATAVFGNGSNAGMFENPGAGVQLEDVGGRHIIEHSVDASIGLWTGEWVAPESGSGEVVFYMSGVAANNNNGSGGDGYDGATMTIGETFVGIDDVQDAPHFAVNANGSTLEGNANVAGTLQIYNLGGQLVHTQEVTPGALKIERSFDAGFYIFKLIGEGFALERKVSL